MSGSALRPVAVGLAVSLLAAACAPHVRVRFTGHDVSDAEGYISVKGKRGDEHIVVSSLKHGFVLQLPYVEDWEFGSGPGASGGVLYAKSPGLNLTVGIEIMPSSRVVDPEAYLRDEVLDEKLGRSRGDDSILNPVILKHGDRAILEYRYHVLRGYPSTHVCSIRQARNGDVYLIDLKTFNQVESMLRVLRPAMRDIAVKYFAITR